MAEGKNRHLLKVTRTLLLESSVPHQFWIEALSTIVYLINRLSSQNPNLSLPIFVFINNILSMNICIHFLVFVLFISLIINIINFLLNLLYVHSWDIPQIIKVLFAMILLPISFVFLIMLFSLKNQLYFPTCDKSLPDIVILPSFDESSSFHTRFKLRFMYEHVLHHHPFLILLRLSWDVILESLLHPIGMALIIHLLLLLYLLFLFHHLIHMQLSMSVGNK